MKSMDEIKKAVVIVPHPDDEINIVGQLSLILH